MDPRSVEINSLRVLNDYLNQTIEAIIRTQRAGVVGALDMTAGLNHSPFVAPFGVASTVPNYLLSHTPYATANLGFATPFATDPTMIDPFLAQRVMSHSAATLGGLSTLGPLADIARRWEVQRAWGVPF